MAGDIAAAIAIPFTVLPWNPWVDVVLGLGLVICGLGVRQWAATTLEDFFTRSVVIREGQRVVTTGPYRCVRHPAYAGILISPVGLALTLGNWLSVALVVTGYVLANVPRIR